MGIDKLTCISPDIKKATFIKISLTKFDISFTKSDQYTSLCLKYSKIIMEYIRIHIILIVISDKRA